MYNCQTPVTGGKQAERAPFRRRARRHTTGRPRLPTGPRLVAPEPHLCFLDSQSLPLAAPLSALEAWSRFMGHFLRFTATAMRTHDMIASRFGVQRLNGFSHRKAESARPGARFSIVLVEESTPNSLS
ncbi:hypothetical protein SAMN04488103_11233 [Gemmobacter aquatilis]|uniref:Uncharacterized protein n=1 Tax=Gemmobacter aquatilis TaxID=933059 RepID=A0A1H8M0F7_9RHOB|nr:hypothetical protein [Gemmobacter aquatilis]SEO10845.1 hypothetical protein SAMN04488103_11233 [Gemmobacter aquatilis]